MPRPYGKDIVDIIPGKMLRSEYTAIGRLVRACAELEDILNHWIAKLSVTPPQNLYLLLGTTPVSKKLELAWEFAQVSGTQFEQLHRNSFKHEAWDDVFATRNFLCHAVFQGRTKQGLLVFRTSKIIGRRQGHVMFSVECISAGMIEALAKVAEHAIPSLERDLGVAASREGLRQKTAGPHPKAVQPSRKTSARKPKA